MHNAEFRGVDNFLGRGGEGALISKNCNLAQGEKGPPPPARSAEAKIFFKIQEV